MIHILSGILFHSASLPAPITDSSESIVASKKEKKKLTRTFASPPFHPRITSIGRLSCSNTHGLEGITRIEGDIPSAV